MGFGAKKNLTVMCQNKKNESNHLNDDEKELTDEQKKEIDRIKEIIQKVESKDTLSQL